MDDSDKYLGNAATTAILVDAGIEMMPQNIKRCDRTMTEEEIDAMLSSWLCRADDPIPGDTAGDVHIRERAP